MQARARGQRPRRRASLDRAPLPGARTRLSTRRDISIASEENRRFRADHIPNAKMLP